MSYKYLFGPVNSRRLGISLGVDMVTFKTCSLNCVYCECGNTTSLSCERKEYVRFDALKNELTDYLSKSPKLDYVTFAGSGEPTLNSCLGRIIDFVKEFYPQYKTALLTNGTLFFDSQVRRECMNFDLICPSLDAVSDETFIAVNRPDQALDNKKVIDGLIQFAQEYKGIMWVEVFIVPGINDSESELKLFRDTLTKIQPQRVQLNSLDRPGACNWVTPVSPQKLSEIAKFLSPLPVEIISRSGSQPRSAITGADLEETVLSLIRRRPSTLEELSVIAGKTINEIHATLDNLKNVGTIEVYSVNDKSFYRVKNDNPDQNT
jgi:wyosine [tRNA(Phe)-imidazoG37] synthetase (radical SAM superfamily)